MSKRILLSPSDDTASRALVNVQTAITHVKEIVSEGVSKGWNEKELTTALNKEIASECKRVDVSYQESFRKSLVSAARKWHYELSKTYKILDQNFAAAAMKQPLNIEIQNLIKKVPFEKFTEFRRLLDDGTNPGIPVIKDYQKSVRLITKAISVDAPKTVTTKNGKSYVMPVRLRAELAVRYAAAVENLQRLIDSGVKWCWISSHANCSPRCADYQGRLYSLFKGEHELDGKIYKITGTIDGIPYRPITEALLGPNGDGNGCISGYNCRHRAIEYERGSKPPKDFTEAEMKREYAIDKQQRFYENRIRQMKTEERQLRACGMTKEAATLRKKWRALTLDYEIYSVEHDRAYYPYRCVIDRTEESEGLKAKTILAQSKGIEIPQAYNNVVIDNETYREKFVELGGKRVVSTVVKESRRCIRINDMTTDERGVFIETNGNSIFSFIGKNSSADYGRFNFSKYKEKSLVLVHNHPHSGSFSADDILTVSDNPQIKTIVAVGHDGTVYQLSIGDGKRVDKNIYSEYNKLMRDHNKNTHIVMLILTEEYGWSYKKL